MFLISSSEDPDDLSLVLAPPLVLPHALPGAALAPFLVPSLPGPVESSSEAPHSPTPP